MAAEHLVLLPGMMCDERMWKAQVAAVDIPVSIPVLAGYDDFAAMADVVLAAAPPRFAVAGLSMGGILAFELWRRAPHRISHLALLDTTPFPDAQDRQVLRIEQIERVLAGGLRALAIDELKPLYLADTGNNDQDLLLETILDMALHHGPEVFRQQSLALKNRVDSQDTLSTIDCPTTVICGAEDRLCPVSFHEYMAKKIPNSRLVVIDQCGHLASMEQPATITYELQRLFAREPHTGINHAIQSEKNSYNSRR